MPNSLLVLLLIFSCFSAIVYKATSAGQSQRVEPTLSPYVLAARAPQEISGSVM